MEEYGLYIENPSGFVQIDGELKNMRVLTHGTVLAGEITIHYPAQPVRPLVMVSPPVDWAVVAKVEVNQALIMAAWDGHTSIDYVVLVPMLDAPLDTGLYVFEVYDANGLLVFSGAENYMAIDGIFSVNTPLSTLTVTVPCPPVPFGKRYFSLTYEYAENSWGIAEWGGILLSNGNLQVGPVGYSAEVMGMYPMASSIQTITGYFNP